MKQLILNTIQIFLLSTLILIAGCRNSHSHDHPHDHGHSHSSEERHHHPDGSKDGNGHSHANDDQGHSHANGDHGHSHYDEGSDRPAFTYLAMDGSFHLNPGDSVTQNDPRNPSRLELSTSEEAGTLSKMAFYDHSDSEKLLAECGYQYIGSRPDPHYYPGESKTSIWDVFEKVEDYEGDCASFRYVISRSPNGDPIHMHLRYGDDVEKLLEMSNDEEDDSFNPWWSTYCDIERTTSCG